MVTPLWRRVANAGRIDVAGTRGRLCPAAFNHFDTFARCRFAAVTCQPLATTMPQLPLPSRRAVGQYWLWLRHERDRWNAPIKL